MNILIITGDFGSGHNSAAQALSEILHKHNTWTIDFIDEFFPNTKNNIYDTFNLLVKKLPFAFNIGYKFTDFIDINPYISNKTIQAIDNIIRKNNINIVICTVPFASKLISHYIDITNSSINLINCITDIYPHNSWLSDKTDIYLVPSHIVKNQLINKDINNKKIVITGIPVKNSFVHSPTIRLKNKKINILIMGGGLGLIPNFKKTLDIIKNIPNISTTIIIGNNKKIYKKLKDIKYDNINIIKYTDNIKYYMDNSDLIITKAGGITLFEAIYTNTPILVTKPFLQQEISNAKFIEESNIGRVIWNNKNINNYIENFITDKISLEIYKRNMQDIKVSLVDKRDLVFLEDIIIPA